MTRPATWSGNYCPPPTAYSPVPLASVKVTPDPYAGFDRSQLLQILTGDGQPAARRFSRPVPQLNVQQGGFKMYSRQLRSYLRDIFKHTVEFDLSDRSTIYTKEQDKAIYDCLIDGINATNWIKWESIPNNLEAEVKGSEIFNLFEDMELGTK